MVGEERGGRRRRGWRRDVVRGGHLTGLGRSGGQKSSRSPFPGLPDLLSCLCSSLSSASFPCPASRPCKDGEEMFLSISVALGISGPGEGDGGGGPSLVCSRVGMGAKGGTPWMEPVRSESPRVPRERGLRGDA